VVTEAVRREGIPTAPAEVTPSAWRPTFATYAAVAAVLAWSAVQLAPFIGEAPDLDAMISLRESIVFHREGLEGLIADRVGTGIHPPLMDMLSSLAFSLFGEDPRSQQLLAIPLLGVLAAAVERLLAPWLPTGQRVVATLAVAICPALAIVMALVTREGLIAVVLAVALAVALAPTQGKRQLLALGAVLALLPLTKDAGLVLVFPFAVFAAVTGEPPAWQQRLRRGATVLALPVATSLCWRAVLALAHGSSWHTWIVSPKADDGPYVVALRAMFGFEDGIYLRQNLANAFIVNYLWLPALLALATLVLAWRRPAPAALQRSVALLLGLVAMSVWTTLTFPTFTVPRYAAPVILCTLVIALLGLTLWPPRARPYVLGALIGAFALGAWSPTDPVTRKLWGTVSVGGERVYDTTERERGPDRTVINFAALRATQRMNARLRRIFATDVAFVTGDCNSMKFGEKLFSVGFQPSAFDRGIPAARPIRCVPLEELPPGAADGAEKIGLVRTIEEEAANQPLPVSGKAIVVLR
jgi:hypothetical protein